MTEREREVYKLLQEIIRLLEENDVAYVADALSAAYHAERVICE